jgi:Protein of unknown function (DUF3631)
VEDRAADTWEPLAAVADLAGGTWPGRARKACKMLVAAAEADDSEASLSLRLLSDLRDIYAANSWPNALFGDALLCQLKAIEAAPWGDFSGGQLTPRALARMLKPYDVRPRDVWIAGTTRKGYRLDDLSDVWARYLPALPPGSGEVAARSARSARSQASPLADDPGYPLGPLGDHEAGT